MPIRSGMINLVEEMRTWRRHLHAHPETAYQEHDTADFIARLLTEWGIEVHRGLAGTGVVGTLKVGSSPRAIGLRADMDALDVEEHNRVNHRSRYQGKMHACGHDGHMAMLLGAAKYLAHSRNFDGTIQFVFQPAEEIQPTNSDATGGQRMVEEGLFERFPVHAVYAMHNMPFIPEGKMVVRQGAVMASSDVFEITVTGKGAHGAWPHQGIDAIGVACEIVLALNHIVARTVDPLESVVVSVTQIHAGHTTNVLPETATLIGTTRAFSTVMQDHVQARMRQICKGIAGAHGAAVKFAYERRCPPTVNHPRETELASEAAARVVGEENVLRDAPPVMGGEDFAWMLLAKPGSYLWIGSGLEHQGSYMLHNPGYDFNDRILPIGASFWVELAESWLQSKQSDGRAT